MKALLKALNVFVYWGYRVLKTIGALCLTTIFLSISVGIFTRYILNSPVTWSEELCCFMMAHICFISSATTTVQKRHIVADFFIAKAPQTFRTFMKFVTYVLELLFFAVLAISVLKLMPRLVWKSPVLLIPRQYYYLSCLVCGIFMFITVLTHILNDIFPGYDLLAEMKAKEEEKAKEAEALETRELQKNMDAFMKSSGYQSDAGEDG